MHAHGHECTLRTAPAFGASIRSAGGYGGEKEPPGRPVSPIAVLSRGLLGELRVGTFPTPDCRPSGNPCHGERRVSVLDDPQVRMRHGTDVEWHALVHFTLESELHVPLCCSPRRPFIQHDGLRTGGLFANADTLGRRLGGGRAESWPSPLLWAAPAFDVHNRPRHSAGIGQARIAQRPAELGK